MYNEVGSHRNSRFLIIGSQLFTHTVFCFGFFPSSNTTRANTFCPIKKPKKSWASSMNKFNLLNLKVHMLSCQLPRHLLLLLVCFFYHSVFNVTILVLFVSFNHLMEALHICAEFTAFDWECSALHLGTAQSSSPIQDCRLHLLARIDALISLLVEFELANVVSHQTTLY